MGGFLGIGGSSSNTDRGNQLASTQGNWNIFNWAMPQGQSQQTSGNSSLSTAQATLGGPQAYYNQLLTAGRTQTQAMAAPAIDATLAQSNATRDAAGTFGTGRTGGTAALNREASTNTQSQIDQITNSTLQNGKSTAATGLTGIAGQQAGIGGTQLANAGQLLGLSAQSINDILSNSTASRQIDPNIGSSLGSFFGQAILGSLEPGGLFNK